MPSRSHALQPLLFGVYELASFVPGASPSRRDLGPFFPRRRRKTVPKWKRALRSPRG